MSITLIRQVRDRRDLDTSERVVLMVLASHATEGAPDGTCYPGIPLIMAETAMTDRGVQKVIARLEDRGFLIVYRSRGPRGTNQYYFRFPPEPGSGSDVMEAVAPRTTFGGSPRTPFTTPPNLVRAAPEPRSPNQSGSIQDQASHHQSEEPEPQGREAGREAWLRRGAELIQSKGHVDMTAFDAKALSEMVAAGWVSKERVLERQGRLPPSCQSGAIRDEISEAHLARLAKWVNGPRPVYPGSITEDEQRRLVERGLVEPRRLKVKLLLD